MSTAAAHGHHVGGEDDRDHQPASWRAVLRSVCRALPHVMADPLRSAALRFIGMVSAMIAPNRAAAPGDGPV